MLTTGTAPPRLGSRKARTCDFVAEGISVAFHGVKALEDAGLMVSSGEIVGLIGPNGAGKTTFVNVVTGFQDPHAGGVTMNGRRLGLGRPRRCVRAGIARTFQSTRLFPQLTIGENLEVAALAAGRSRREARAVRDEILEYLGLAELVHVLACEESYGIQRTVGIGRALATDPAVLFLDEPAAGANEEETDELAARLRLLRDQRGVGIVLIEHDMRLVMGLCEQLVVLDHGKVIATGPTPEVSQDANVIRAYLGDASGHA